jgi:hypothetical protein
VTLEPVVHPPLSPRSARRGNPRHDRPVRIELAGEVEDPLLCCNSIRIVIRSSSANSGKWATTGVSSPSVPSATNFNTRAAVKVFVLLAMRRCPSIGGCVAPSSPLDAAIESGTASPYVDVDALFEFLRGATVVRALTRGDDDAEDFCRQIAEALFTLVAATRR